LRRILVVRGDRRMRRAQEIPEIPAHATPGAATLQGRWQVRLRQQMRRMAWALLALVAPIGRLSCLTGLNGLGEKRRGDVNRVHEWQG